MPHKKIYTRKEFKAFRNKLSKAIASDRKLKRDALDVASEGRPVFLEISNFLKKDLILYAMGYHFRLYPMAKTLSTGIERVDNNPKTALVQFLKENNRFELDKTIEDKLLLSVILVDT